MTDPRTGALLAMLVAIDKAEKDSQDCLFRTHCFTESDRWGLHRSRNECIRCTPATIAQLAGQVRQQAAKPCAVAQKPCGVAQSCTPAEECAGDQPCPAHMLRMLASCSAAVAVWAIEVASIITSWSLELSFAAALAGARGDSEPKGLDIVLQVHALLTLACCCTLVLRLGQR